MQDLWTSAGEIEPTLGLFVVGVLGMAVLAAGIVADLRLLAGLARRRPDWRGAIERLRRRPWRRSDGAALLLALGATYLLLAWHADGNAAASAADIRALPFVGHTMVFHGMAAAAILALMRIRRTTWRAAFGNGGSEPGSFARDARKGALFYLAAMPPVILCAVLARLLLAALNVPVEPQEAVALFVSEICPVWMRVYLAALAILAAPVIEETCFRGIALPLLTRRVGIGAAIVGVSLIFAAVHFHAPSFAPLFAIATAFSLAYLHTGSLTVPIVMHTLFNAVSLAALLLLHALPQPMGLP